jgi:hypothetical protein
MLFALIKAIISKCPERLPSLQIIVCDTDSDVHQWHVNFFPKEVKSVNCDITAIKSTPETLFYFNFCGMGETAGVDKFLNYLRSASYQSAGFVSFSSRNLRNKYWLTKQIDIRFVDVTPDKLKFKTIQIIKEKVKVIVTKEGKEIDHKNLIETAKSSNSLKSIKEFVVMRNLKTNVGGWNKRTLVDIRDDIVAALTEAHQEAAGKLI